MGRCEQWPTGCLLRFADSQAQGLGQVCLLGASWARMAESFGPG